MPSATSDRPCVGEWEGWRQALRIMCANQNLGKETPITSPCYADGSPLDAAPWSLLAIHTLAPMQT